jgi:hypothetical protein
VRLDELIHTAKLLGSDSHAPEVAVVAPRSFCLAKAVGATQRNGSKRCEEVRFTYYTTV